MHVALGPASRVPSASRPCRSERSFIVPRFTSRGRGILCYLLGRGTGLPGSLWVDLAFPHKPGPVCPLSNPMFARFGAVGFPTIVKYIVIDSKNMRGILRGNLHRARYCYDVDLVVLQLI